MAAAKRTRKTAQHKAQAAATDGDLEAAEAAARKGAAAKKRAAKKTASKTTKGANRDWSKEKLERRDDEYFSKRPEMRNRRDRFIAEYLIDFNATGAARRIGIPAASAGKQGSELLNEPYVYTRVRKHIEELNEEAVVTRKEVLVGLKREANYHGFDSFHGARISAWSRLGKLLGMEEKETGAQMATGVMVVPLASTEDEWEAAAMQQQKGLKNAVRD